MSKLFSMESDEVVADEALTDVDAVAANVTEDADAMGEDLAADAAATDGVQAGVDAIAPLEEVEAVLTEAAESGEGLDKVAAEAVRIAVASICRPIGADPKRLYPLYATENFDSASARLGNTKLALEGATEFIKELYERIKAALKRMWEKAKAFWNKHFSTLGRMKKAVVVLKKKAGQVKTLKATPFIEKMPSAFGAAFGPSGELTAKDVVSRIDVGAKYGEEMTKLLATLNSRINVMRSKKTMPELDFKVGEDIFTVKGMTGGRGYRAYTEGDKPSAEDKTVNISFKIEKDDEAFDVDLDKGMRIASVAEINEILNKIEVGIDTMISYNKSGEKLSVDLSKALNEVAGMEKNQDAAAARQALSVGYKMATFADKLMSIAASEAIRSAKHAISYVAFNLNQYKTK